MRLFRLAPIIHQREGIAQICRPLFHAVDLPAFDDGAQRAAGAARQPGAFQAIAEVVRERSQQAARSGRTERLDRVQVVRFGLLQSGVIGQRIQLGYLLLEQGFDFRHLFRHALRAKFDLLRGVAVDR